MIAAMCRAKRDRYAVLADRLTLVRASNPDTDSGGGISGRSVSC
jgi:hypothetical protein